MWAAMAVHWAAGVGTGCGFGWLPRKTSGSLPAMTLCNVSSSDGVHFSRVRGLTFAGMLAVVLALQCCLCFVLQCVLQCLCDAIGLVRCASVVQSSAYQ